MYGAAFYTNICKLLSTLHGGIKHQRPTVKMPLSKVGLELSRILTNLGIIEDFTIGQHLSRVRAHSRLWDPARTHIERSRDAAGYSAMYLTLHLNYDKHKPLWCHTPLAAAPHTPTLPFALTSSSSSSSLLPSTQHFTPPLGLNSPTPESIKLISKPSVQRCLSLREILSKRRDMRPGIFLLSTHEGLLTDIDCELRGMGGVVLAHLGLPYGQVVQLRGLLRQKYMAELAAALPARSTADASEQELLRAQQRTQHVPLAEWDARAAAVSGLAERVQQQVGPGMQLIMEQEQRFDDDISAARKARQTGRFDPAQPWQLLQEAQQRLAQLELQESAWLQRGPRARGQDRGDRGDRGDFSSRASSSGSGRGRVGGGRAGDDGRQGSGSRRQALFDQQPQRSSGGGSQDRWTPSGDS